MYFWDQHKTIIRYYETLTKSVCDKYRLTKMEYDILMFLFNNRQYKTAAEIVKVRKCTKSHVSMALKNLEEKGLIKKKQSQDNKKHVEILVLDKTKDIAQDGFNLQKQFAKGILKDLNDDEVTAFKAVFNKICHNADECLRQNKYRRGKNV